MRHVFVEVSGVKIGAIGALAPAIGLCRVVALEDTSLDQQRRCVWARHST
jgi:hypothetical protein